MMNPLKASQSESPPFTRARSTGIEWTEHTWNVWAGCSAVSPGCKNCYAARLASRLTLMGLSTYDGLTDKRRSGTPTWTGKLTLSSESVLTRPLALKRPSVFFVNSMSDFFHPDAPDAWRALAFRIFRLSPHHVFQVLTKRPENILPFLERSGESFPDNVWVGTTIEHAATVGRAEILKRVPAHIRFLSVEPLIGDPGDLPLSGIQWVISGGESGPRARECLPEWIYRVDDACRAHKVPHFFKQWGRPANNPIYRDAPSHSEGMRLIRALDPIGKGGSLLLGRYVKDMPNGQTLAPWLKGSKHAE